MRKATRLGQGGVAVFGVFLSGCATLINSPTQSVLITSDPAEAKVVIDDRVHLKTPGMVRLSRKATHMVVFQKEGYKPEVVRMTRGPSAWSLLDVLCLPLMYFCFRDDLDSGGFYVFDDTVHMNLTKLKNGEDVPVRPESSSMVPP
jgi:hypothetical protein